MLSTLKIAILISRLLIAKNEISCLLMLLVFSALITKYRHCIK
jgi:hypothetical protein